MVGVAGAALLLGAQMKWRSQLGIRAVQAESRLITRALCPKPSDPPEPSTMATLQHRKPLHATHVEIVSVMESTEGDEALKLVGRERTAQFSEEYNRRLRRKLVSVIVLGRENGNLMRCAPRVGSRNSSSLRCSVFYAVSVRLHICIHLECGS